MKESRCISQPQFTERNLFDLTSPQTGIWYTEKFYPDSGLNNIAGTLQYDGELNFDFLNEAFNKFIRMHDGVRLRIRTSSGEIKQYISDYSDKKVDFLDFSDKSESDYSIWEREKTQAPMFGEDKDLYYFCMLKFPDNKSGFFVKFHHIISDAWSTVMIGDQVIHYYKEYSSDIHEEENAVPSYTEFIEKDREYTKSERYQKDKKFWMDEFKDIPEIASIKTSNKKNMSISAARKSFDLPEKLVNKLRSYSESHKKSIFVLFLSSLAIYINRITEKEDLVIGIPTLNRVGKLEKSIFGLFVNTVPIPISVSADDSYLDFSETITLKWKSVLRHHRYPAYQIMRDIRESHPGIDKLYDVMISYQNAKFTKNDIENDFNSTWHFQGSQNESLYVHINDRESDNEIHIDYDYLTDIFYGKDIEALHDHMVRLLWHALDAPEDRKIYDLEMVSEKEKDLILNTFNDTEAKFPDDITMIDVFSMQVQQFPDDPVVYFGDLRMTYKELDVRSDHVAKLLRAKGVTNNTVVGIMLPRSFEMMISILSIWKAGGAYMPVDPDLPDDRIDYMFTNSKAQIVLTKNRYIENKESSMKKISVIDMSDDMYLKQMPPRDVEPTKVHPEDLAYVIYTSGSTGKPKGVMNEHRALMNRVNWMQKKYPLENDDVILQKTTYIFDVSVWELTWWFYCGARMVFLTPGGEKNPGEIISAIEQYGVTTMHFVPSMLGAFLTFLEASDDDVIQRIRTLKRVFASGEALTLKQVERFNSLLNKSNSTTLHNLYGPTEAAIDVSYYDCPETEVLNSVPIGKPIDNIQLYIVNQYNKLQPINVAGELCIAGTGLARGYLNNEKLTREKFVDNPFSPGTKMYRTGDLARWYPRGDIEYIGRIDSQIKIRGFRIELGEIQTHLISLPQIENAVVTSVDDNNGNISICAYLIPFSEKSISIENVNKYLKTKLPEYMIPADFVIIKDIPLLSNGKINYKALPKPDIKKVAIRDSVNPRNEIESDIFSAWASILEKSNFGVTDDFFDPIVGGDSLRAIEVVCALPKKDDVLIDITDFYQNPTIEALAALYSDDVNSEKAKRRSTYLINLTSNNSHSDSRENSNNITYICCPYGGGSAFVYSQLAQSLQLTHEKHNESCSVYSVNLPGHNFENGEKEFVDIETAADRIMSEVRFNEKITNSKIVIYAHCVGNALGLNLLRRMENENFNVICMFAGAIFPSKFIRILPANYDPWKRFKDDSLYKYLLKIGFPGRQISENAKTSLMSAFRFDVRQYYKYLKTIETENLKPISSPIISIVGENDQMVVRYKKKFKIYSKYTYGMTSLIVVKNAQHYFIKTHAELTSDLIRTKLVENELINPVSFQEIL